MIKGGRIIFDDDDLEEAGRAIVEAWPKVSESAARRVARIAFEAIGMDPKPSLDEGDRQ